MIDLVKKQQIIIKHRGGTSNRQIAIDLGIDKNTVNKYVDEYEEVHDGGFWKWVQWRRFEWEWAV